MRGSSQYMWCPDVSAHSQFGYTLQTYGMYIKHLVDVVKAHYCPPPSVRAQHFTFNSQMQRVRETLAEFMAELRRLSEH